MKTIRELLRDADPLRDEPALPSSRRAALRETVVEAAVKAQPPTRNGWLRFARFATVSVVTIAIVALGIRLWPRMGFETYAAVRFEVRLAEETAAPGLIEAKVAGSDRTIYLHQEIVVSNGDIASAQLLPARTGSQFVVGVTFTAEGARKMAAATQNHIGKPVAILVDDEVVMAPTVRSAIGGAAEINGNYTKEQAERIVNGLK